MRAWSSRCSASVRAAHLGRLRLLLHLLLDGTGAQLGVGDALRRRRLGPDLHVVGLPLGLVEQAGRALLGLADDAGRLLVGSAQHLGALLAEGGRQGGLVEHRVLGPVLGIVDLTAEVLLPLLPGGQLTGHHLEERADLLGVEAPAHRQEGVASHLSRCQPGR